MQQYTHLDVNVWGLLCVVLGHAGQGVLCERDVVQLVEGSQDGSIGDALGSEAGHELHQLAVHAILGTQHHWQETGTVGILLPKLLQDVVVAV